MNNINNILIKAHAFNTLSKPHSFDSFDYVILVLCIINILVCLTGLFFAARLLFDIINFNTSIGDLIERILSRYFTKRPKVSYGLTLVCFIVFVFLLYKYFIKIL